ncbi:MAG: M56 family metallopeptidase, partial [Planctomycetota bacterium]
MNLESAELLKAVLHLAIGSTLVLATGLATILACSGQSSATRHLAGALTCAALLVLPITAVAFPGWRLGMFDFAANSTSPESTALVADSGSPNETLGSQPSVAALPRSRPAASRIKSERQTEAGLPAATEKSFVQRLVELYLLGVSCGFALLAADHFCAHRLRRRSVEFQRDVLGESATGEEEGYSRSPVSIRASEHIVVPMAIGLLRPTVLLPSAAASWPADRVRSAIAHERAHLERHDLAVQLVAKIVAILYWPQPLVHLLVSTMRANREFACDDRVVVQGQRPTEYARHLLSVAADLDCRRRQSAGVLTMARTSHVEHRITEILNRSRRRTPPSRRTVALMLVAIVTSLFGSGLTSPYAGSDTAAVAQRPTKNEARTAVLRRNDEPASDAYVASGRVIGADGEPIAGAIVMAREYDEDFNGTTVTQTTNAEGEYQLVYPVCGRGDSGF